MIESRSDLTSAQRSQPIGMQVTLRCAVFLAAILVFTTAFSETTRIRAPYPPSPVIRGVTWDFDNIVRAAPGSDGWAATWAGDDNLYVIWGDGGGFGGTDIDRRVTLGIARIEGSADNWQGFNIFGGENSEAPATFDGKSGAIVSIDGVLHAFIIEQDAWMRAKIGLSTDYGRTWLFNGETFADSDWDFAEFGGAFAGPAILQFGRDYSGARDNFVYLYSEKTRSDSNRDLLLGRVPKRQIQDRSAYEFFAGIDYSGNPLWTPFVDQAQPVLTDPRGINWGFAASYNDALKRYLITVRRPDNSGGQNGAWAIFDAPEPWGPWTTVAYYDNWANGTDLQIAYNLPTKWMSSDGKTMWMIASMDDSFNVVKATLTLAEIHD